MREEFYIKHNDVLFNMYRNSSTAIPNFYFDTTLNKVSTDYCKFCRLCCSSQHNFDENYDLPLPLDSRFTDTDVVTNFTKGDRNTAFLSWKGCGHNSEDGCTSPIQPVNCAIYPYIFHNMELYVDTTCPAAMNQKLSTLYDIAEHVAKFLTQFDSYFLHRLSMPKEFFLPIYDVCISTKVYLSTTY